MRGFFVPAIVRIPAELCFGYLSPMRVGTQYLQII